MAKYCPVCLGEFQDSVTTCPKHDGVLTHKKPQGFDRLIDFYAAKDELEAEHIISLLEAEGMIARESVAGISQLPVSSDTRFIIAVLREDLTKAKKFIEQARLDNIISNNGSFI